MSTKTIDVDETKLRPHYVGWRGELLAELALARVPGLAVNKRGTARPDFDLGYDFLVATRRGLCFFVQVKAFSSLRLGTAGPEATGDWRWRVEADLIRQLRRSHAPFLLFLFDADTEEGRYLRVDTLAAPADDVQNVSVRLPSENLTDREGLEALIARLESERTP